jgi:hypothetical protein
VIIPQNPLERQLLVEELVRHCAVSRIDRFNFYRTARNYLLFGTSDAQGCPYNRIKATAETLASFVYSPDDVRFSLKLHETAPPADIVKAPTLGRFVTDTWRRSKAHFIFDKAVIWSLAYGCFLIKNFWRNGRVYTYTVEPHQFGVYREDVMDLGEQEAFTHHYAITPTELASSLQGNPRRAAIMERVGKTMADQLPPLATGLQRLVLGSPVAGTSGSLAIPGAGNAVGPGGMGGTGPSYDYMPRIEAELIDMCDLYVWNDAIDDYQVFTRAAPDVVIYDRPSSWLGHVRGVPPFSVVRTSNLMYDWFWGDSFVADLCWLQEWRTERISDVRELLRKQFDPPMSIVGGTGVHEEKLLALRKAGGQVPFPVPTAKVNVHAPVMPEDVFRELQQIDMMFDEQAGIGHVLQGRGEAGVRSKGQVDTMARLSSSRPKRRAMVVESCAEDVAAQQLLLAQEHSEHRFTTMMDGKPLIFTAEQFTREYELQIDSHSASPIFVEDRKHDAVTLRESHAIDRATMLEFFNPPNVQALQERLKAIEKAEEEARQEQLKIQLSQGAPPRRQVKSQPHA